MSNLTRAETRARAARLTVHAVTVELDLRAARDPGTATAAPGRANETERSAT